MSGHSTVQLYFITVKIREIKAIESKNKLEASGRYSNPVVTEIIPAPKFYPAEDYHQQYLKKRGKKFCGI